MRPRPDAAENLHRYGFAGQALLRFNEAAARCRGKLAARVRRQFAGLASMRPRPDAAENRRPGRREDGRARASMRPRPDAAENASNLHAAYGVPLLQ